MELEFDKYVQGGKNRDGKEIEEIYVREEEKYIIYKCKNLNYIHFDGIQDISKNMSKISLKLSNVEMLVNTKGINSKLFYEQIAYAYVLAANGDINLAEKTLDQIEKKIIMIRRKNGRIYYLLGAITMILISAFIAIGVTININYFIEKQINEMKIISYVITAGSLGGFLSMSLKINDLDIDSDSGFWTNYIAGMLRLIIAICCSIITFLIIKSNLALGFVAQGNSNYALITFGVVSGFSETFIPNVITKLEAKGLEA